MARGMARTIWLEYSQGNMARSMARTIWLGVWPGQYG